ncbi:glycoside hydrolase family 5 protein [Pseudomonas sp. dw_358]|uniref:glycoside hydrolase family 5 protein n=1 Tax=Pseudomonas sp. dw_358 TaxID=2720083 RepID=UPI001BD4B887|nr:glycoside hydrolase family 5 protein [Pseudomonas sp. dw_358]
MPSKIAPDASPITSLDLDFVAKRYSIGVPLVDLPLERLATFSRPSVAGYWRAWNYATAAANQPRIEDSGLILEGARSNLLRPLEMPQAWLYPPRGTVNGAPGMNSGQMTGFVSARDNQVAQQNLDIPRDRSVYSLSLWVKAKEAGKGRVYLPETGVYPHPSNGHDEAWYDFASDRLGGDMVGHWQAERIYGWTRLSVVHANAHQAGVHVLKMRNDPQAEIIYGGIQLEKGARPTSMIPQSWGIAERAPERLHIPPGAWNAVPGALRVDADKGVVAELRADGLHISGTGTLRRIEYVQHLVLDEPFQLMAMNIAGAEFGQSMPGVHGTHYFWPNVPEFDLFKGFGVTHVRLPFKWERIQHEMQGELHEPEMQRLFNALNAAQGAGMKVLLDMHNYYVRKIDGVDYDIGTGRVPIDAWVDGWERLVQRVKGHPAVWAYGLMNEPMGTSGRWAEGAQRCVDVLRRIDPDTPIAIAGDQFSSALFWHEANAGHLPLRGDNLIYEAHLYLDGDASGRYTNRHEAIAADTGIRRAQPFVNWLKTWGLKGFIGECGVPADMPAAMVAMERLLEYATANRVPVFYWAGGSHWPAGHETACQYQYQLREQVDVMARHRLRVVAMGPFGETLDE